MIFSLVFLEQIRCISTPKISLSITDSLLGFQISCVLCIFVNSLKFIIFKCLEFSTFDRLFPFVCFRIVLSENLAMLKWNSLHNFRMGALSKGYI